MTSNKFYLYEDIESALSLNVSSKSNFFASCK